MDRYLFFVYICLAVLLIARYGILAATESEGLRKGRSRLIAAFTFCSGFVFLPLLQINYEAHLLVYELEGTIRSVRILDGSAKYYSAYLEIVTTTGGDISVHVSDRNDAWHSGQRLKIRYYGDIGEMIDATLLSLDGQKEGKINRTAILGRACSIVVGLFLCGGVWIRYRRDPEGKIENTDSSSGITGTVDQDSLLHLSEINSEEYPIPSSPHSRPR